MAEVTLTPLTRKWRASKRSDETIKKDELR
jgi:hypothetical protein